MKNEPFYDNNLDNLFQIARNQEPICAFSETQSAFLTGAAVGITSFAAAKILGSSIFKYKFLIMTISSITILTGAFLFFNSATVEAREYFTAKSEQTLPTKQLKQSHLQSVALNSYLDNSSIFSELSENPLILNALIAKPLQTYNLNSEFKLLPTINLKKETKEDTILVIHKVTEKTTDEELEFIRNDAEKAGIDFKYKLERKANSIQKFTYRLKGIENEQLYSSMELGRLFSSKEFSIYVSWRIDREGKVIDFYQYVPESAYMVTKKLNDRKINKLKRKREKLEEDLQEVSINTYSIGNDLEEDNNDYAIQEKSASDIMLNRNTKQNSMLVSHILNVNTTEIDLESVQKDATAAGIVFVYNVSYKKQEIVKLVVEMIIRTDDGNMRSEVRITRKKGESFSVPIIWRIDESGKAIDFGDPKQVRYL